MSNFLYARVVGKESRNMSSLDLCYSIIKVASDNNFAVSFIDTLPTIDTTRDINFCISDHRGIRYCEYFMEPIIYSLDGEPLTENLQADIDCLYFLVCEIFKYEPVKTVELRFSYVEVEEEDYKIFDISIEEMRCAILNEYMSQIDFPVAKFVIRR